MMTIMLLSPIIEHNQTSSHIGHDLKSSFMAIDKCNVTNRNATNIIN